MLPTSNTLGEFVYPFDGNHITFTDVMFLEEFPYPFSVAEEITRLPIASIQTNIRFYRLLQTFDEKFEFFADTFCPVRLSVTFIWEKVMVAAQIDMFVS